MIQEEIILNENRIRNIEDRLADKQIDLDTFNQSKNRFVTTIMTLKGELEESSNNESDYQKYLKTGINLLNNIVKFYRDSPVRIKRNIIGSIFPERISFSKKNCRTTKINEAVRLIMATDKGFNENKTGQLFKNIELPGSVESIGVEPTTSCMPCKRSSQLS